ncbi:Sugar transferase involved in LPS biosynthesis (colanic, teichoic acid) [Cyclobacterium lianum]|uniref:Sugar transferase involved in LPS biosynthesis (Colanic, teichoic acid) n=1 Tax=Cyclobacterium lianum TaxID=388280 RepID=A0A1M7NH72_9BACT|nr:sugar transferase [Cyclobacterium lianum]SHN03070.1 Sugar transferase involved in LPS biosynthesis (colanic, teichoic acid) [Cyclobacterium lianum]
MEKFLRRAKEPDIFSAKLSGYITPDGAVYLTDPQKLLIKRFFDLTISVFLILFVMSWVVPLIALMIRIDSRGPILYRQLRHGKGNKAFWCYKFRTMKANTESDLLQASKNDQRVTRVGRFLRKSSLDEIPQVINVLIGEMSLIGPRPHAVPMNHVFSNEINNYMFRHVVKPGITGLAQSRGYRGEIIDHFDIYGRVKLDHFYIRKWCLFLDLKIVFWTLSTILFKNGKAY